MNTTLPLATDERIAELNAWFARMRLKKADVAAEMGIHPSMLSRIISGDRAPIKRIEQLKSLGVPDELLPQAKGPPGRPRKKRE